MHCLYLEKYILMAKQIIADFCCLAFVVNAILHNNSSTCLFNATLVILP